MWPPGLLRPSCQARPSSGAKETMRRAARLFIQPASLFLSLLLLLLSAVHGTAGDLWDAAFTVAMNPFPATALALENMEMTRALLYPPNSKFIFLPAAYQAPTAAASLSMSNCSISSLCSTVQAYALFTAATSPTNLGGSSQANKAAMLSNQTLYISRFVSSSPTFNVSLVNTTISCSSSQPMPARTSAASSSELLSALTALSTLNVSAGNTVQLQGVIHTIYSSGWPTSGVSLGPGKLSMTSVPGSRAVVDLGMNTNVINALTGPIHVSNLTLVNLCTTKTVIQGFNLYSSFGLAALYRPAQPWGTSNSSNKPLMVHASTLMVPRFEIYALMYWTAIYPGPFAKINAYAAVFMRAYPNNPPEGFALSKDRLQISVQYDSLSFMDVTMHAADVPPPPEAQGVTVLPPTECTMSVVQKPLVPASVMEDDTLNPLFTVLSTQGLTAALLAAGTRRFSYPPLVMLFEDCAVDSSVSGLTFGFDVILAGISTKQTAAGNPTNATLDLQQMQEAAISLSGPNTGLFLQRLTLINPRVSSVSSWDGRAGSTALPLWGFQFNRSNATRIVMDSVTLVLPVASFAPLYALAKSGGPSMLAEARAGAFRGWAALMHPVLDGITAFSIVRYDVSTLVVSTLEGWGMTATNLVIRADSAYTDDQPPASDDSSSSSNMVRTVVLSVVLTVLGVLLLAVGAAYWYRRHKRLLTPPPEPKTVDNPTVCCPACPDTGGMTSSTGSVCGGNNFKSLTMDGLSSVGWDPMKEVQQFAGLVQAKEEDSLQLLEPIGTGGFGTVYHGRWRNLDVAVKTVLFTCKDGSHDAPERQAIKEAAVCSSIIHPNVVATFHYDIRPVQAMLPEGAMPIQDHAQPRDWKMYLVQELCHSSLADALASGFFHQQPANVPKLDLILSSLLDVAKGLEYIHGKNIIHGDLKPENVLLRVEPSNPHGVISKITDLGLCSTLDPTKSHVSCFNGTPFYAAPEIAATGKTTKLSDVFSFGILMVEVYRRETPWIRTPQGFHPNDSFLIFHEKVPAAYLSLVDRCLQQDPKKRPDLTEIRAALEAIIGAQRSS